MNVLISGAFGFIGTSLSKALKESPGFHLTAVDVFKPDNHVYDEYFDWHSLNSLDWNKIEAVIHLAGKAHDTKNNTTNDQVYFQINLGLTQQIFNYFLKSRVKKFIFFSSVKAVADEVLEEKLTEDSKPNPKTAYGMSKLMAEQYIQDHNLPEKKQTYILRPCMIHGPGNIGNLNLLYKFVQKGIPWPLGNYNNKRSFTCIDNLTFVISQILEKEIEQGIYQIADDESVSTNRLVEMIAESIGNRPRIWKFNKKMTFTTAKIGNVFHFPLNTERLKKLTDSYVVSNLKIKQNIGVEKMPFSAEEGLMKTLKSFQ